MQAYRMLCLATSDGDGNATLDMRVDGVIRHILLTASLLSDSLTNEGMIWELSFGATRVTSSNDVQQTIATLELNTFSTTSGPTYANECVFLHDIDISVQAGERIFIHTDALGTPSVAHLYATLYIEEKSGGGRPSPRRGR